MNVLVHGGAGATPASPAESQEQLDRAVGVASQESTPIEAVETAVRSLESAPEFNAGVGSAVQSDGAIRTDAGLMTGDGDVGAAAGMPGVEHAVEVARVVATETPHVLVAGEGAVSLAKAYDVDVECDLWTDRTRERWADSDPPAASATREAVDWVTERFGGSDTVGAVATDGSTVATATSTGGRWGALAGRVGDVPQVGSGFYADVTAAASATGAGEAIAEFGLARRVVEAVDDGKGPQTAADREIRRFERETGSHAGVIVVDATGRYGQSFNSDSMLTARE